MKKNMKGLTLPGGDIAAPPAAGPAGDHIEYVYYMYSVFAWFLQQFLSTGQAVCEVFVTLTTRYVSLEQFC